MDTTTGTKQETGSAFYGPLTPIMIMALVPGIQGWRADGGKQMFFRNLIFCNGAHRTCTPTSREHYKSLYRDMRRRRRYATWSIKHGMWNDMDLAWYAESLSLNPWNDAVVQHIKVDYNMVSAVYIAGPVGDLP